MFQIAKINQIPVSKNILNVVEEEERKEGREGQQEKEMKIKEGNWKRKIKGRFNNIESKYIYDM